MRLTCQLGHLPLFLTAFVTQRAHIYINARVCVCVGDLGVSLQPLTAQFGEQCLIHYIIGLYIILSQKTVLLWINHHFLLVHIFHLLLSVLGRSTVDWSSAQVMVNCNPLIDGIMASVATTRPNYPWKSSHLTFTVSRTFTVTVSVLINTNIDKMLRQSRVFKLEISKIYKIILTTISKQIHIHVTD